MEIFFVGAKPWTARLTNHPVMVSINALHDYAALRTSYCALVDSGAFTLVSSHGGYPVGSLPKYASKALQINNQRILGFVTQDYMCESFVLAKTGYTVLEHQRFTIYRYKALTRIIEKTFYVMPVIQGYQPDEYVEHVRMYGEILPPNAWVGVGSICKRNEQPELVYPVLAAIKSERPDLKLHGFGLKKTALQNSCICNLLFSSDSFAWSYDARRNGLNTDSSYFADKYAEEIYCLIRGRFSTASPSAINY
ncbi:hypothetical protein [Nostoc sp. CCY 9925]|uniref:deazapurine DNA modification protein DpdA family protein n=1 Tax=Nostoc sp. CCY 9925 TaxID=3103865 RepID=UPI0039C6CE7D